MSISVPGTAISAGRIKGNIMLADNLWFDGLTFSLAGSEFAMNGRIDGVDSWIRKRSGDLSVTAGIWSDRLDRKMITSLSQGGNKDEKQPGSTTAGTRVSLNLDLKLDSLVIDNFRASMFSGGVSYSKNLLNVSSFSLNSLGGLLSGNVAVAELSDGHYLGKGFFNIDRIDINKAFGSLNNFGQSYITSSNLYGNLSGAFSISGQLDSLFRPDMNSLQATGNWIVINGELVGFEPVMKLSRFVDLEELRDIKFSELKNDLVIKNRTVIIPSMVIKSSAFSLALSGDHSFEGNYTYHLKLLLSDLLNKKSKAGRQPSGEFGVIEQDNLGNTSLYLKIEGTTAGSKVSYDMKNLRIDMKKDVEQEKVTLKSILKEEYGWYAGDSIPVAPKSETRKFRITWEEADSIHIDEPVKEEKGLPLKNLLRKKKSGEGIPS
ncbi:MAG: AsmA-like C-terminal region-containing protein [Bacteroidales bacterium]